MRSRAFVLMLALGLAGCGGGEASRTTDDASKPLDGRKVGKASQLTGTWMRVSPGQFLGFEFLKDGKVMATVGGVGRTMTLDFSVLDGGRLSLIAPGGATTVFGATLDGDLLELARETGALGSELQRFSRVPSGKTLAIALQERAAALQVERERRYAALEELLAADDLVIAKVDAKDSTFVLAVKFDHWKPNISGSVVMDDAPGRDDPLRPVRVHPLSGSINPLDEETDRLQIQLNVQGASAPANQQDIQGRVTLIMDGSIGRSALNGTAQFPKLWSGEANVTLKRDRSQHAAATAHFEAQQEKLRRAMAQVAEPLGGRAVLTGQKTVLGGGAPQEITLTIERVGETLDFRGTAKVGPRENLVATGGLGTVIGRGALYISLPTGEQWRLHLDDAGRTYSGQWRPNTQADFISHGNVELTLGRVWTTAEVAAERAAIERFLQADLRTATPFTGFVQSGRGDDIEYWPVWLELQTNADGTAKGKAWLLGQGVGVQLSGRLAGGTFQLNTSGALPGSANSRTLANQRWQLAVSAIDPAPRLSGSMSATMGGTSTVELTPVGTRDAAATRRALFEALRAGNFRVVNTTISRRPEPTYFRFQVDAGANTVSGDAVGADMTGSTSAALPPGMFTGTVVEEHGHAVLKITVDGSPEPVRKRDSRRFEFSIVAHTLGDELILTGWDPPGTGNQTWLRFTPVAGNAAVEVSAEQKIRLAAQKLGASINAPAQPTPGTQALVLVHATERDGRVGQIYSDGTRYSHGNTIATAALHAGVMSVGETAILRLTYGAPFTDGPAAVEKNGITSSKGYFKANNTAPTFTVARVNPE